MNKKMEVSSDLELKQTFITLLSPEILLAHLDINNNDWLTYDSDWLYKVEKKDITLPFQRILNITNNMENIEIYIKKQKHLTPQPNQLTSFSGIKLETAEKIIRTILNLADVTPIENWTQKIENRTLDEVIIANKHIKILSVV
jgi:hypothetical protein